MLPCIVSTYGVVYRKYENYEENQDVHEVQKYKDTEGLHESCLIGPDDMISHGSIYVNRYDGCDATI